MYINPNRAIQEGWVKFPEWMDEEFRQKCIQPNAIDVTLDRVFDLKTTTNLVLSEETKLMRETQELFPTAHRHELDNLFAIPTGCIDIMSDFHVTVPAGVAAFLIVRSTLNRNGIFVTSGLYDQGFSNYVGFVLRNEGPMAFIAPHTRVAQLVFVAAEDSGQLYSGDYNKSVGEHWSDIQPVVDIVPQDPILPEGVVNTMLQDISGDDDSFKVNEEPTEVIDFVTPKDKKGRGTKVTTLPKGEENDN